MRFLDVILRLSKSALIEDGHDAHDAQRQCNTECVSILIMLHSWTGAGRNPQDRKEFFSCKMYLLLFNDIKKKLNSDVTL